MNFKSEMRPSTEMSSSVQNSRTWNKNYTFKLAHQFKFSCIIVNYKLQKELELHCKKYFIQFVLISHLDHYVLKES